jgi:hypothetical protein
VPLHADHPPARVVALHTFDHAVICARTDAYRVAEAIDSLMVDGVHAERLSADDFSKPRRRLDVHVMHAHSAFVIELVSGNVLSL